MQETIAVHILELHFTPVLFMLHNAQQLRVCIKNNQVRFFSSWEFECLGCFVNHHIILAFFTAYPHIYF